MEISESSLQFLDILIPLIGTVLVALITALPEIIKLLRQAAHTPDQNSAKPSGAPIPATVPSPASGRRWVYLRHPILIGGLSGLALSLTGVLALRQFTIEPPSFIVQELYIKFEQPDDLPQAGNLIVVPPRAHTSGLTVSIADRNRYMWVFVCRRDDEVKHCDTHQLFLNQSGGWNNFIQIGRAEDDCVVFEVGFAALDDDTHRQLVEREAKILFAYLPQDKFLDFKWFETVRAQTQLGDRIVCQQT